MKECPVCGARCFDDMEVCYGCLHDFSREDASPIGQVVPSSCDQEIEEAVMPSGDRRSVVPRFAHAGFGARAAIRRKRCSGRAGTFAAKADSHRGAIGGKRRAARDLSGVSIGHKFGGSASSVKAAVSFHPSSCFVLIGPFIPAD